jgi:hypothetical protein
MAETSLDTAESMAKLIVETEFGVEVERRDRHTHEGLHDFDIHLSDATVPMEVKTATNQYMRRLYARLMKHGMELPAAGKWEWQVNLRAEADVGRLFKQRDQLALGLRALEEQDLNFVPRGRHRSEGSIADLFLETFPEIDAAWGWRFPKASPKVHLLPPTDGGAIGPGVVNEFVSKFVTSQSDEGRLDKLYRVDAHRRHIFIWLESTWPIVWSSFCDNALPGDRPKLPDRITDVWVAGYCRGFQIQAWYLPSTGVWRLVRER